MDNISPHCSYQNSLERLERLERVLWTAIEGTDHLLGRPALLARITPLPMANTTIFATRLLRLRSGRHGLLFEPVQDWIVTQGPPVRMQFGIRWLRLDQWTRSMP